jgi:uncharacterized membrane protein YgaE (UPF0421/DUF939 family)
VTDSAAPSPPSPPSRLADPHQVDLAVGYSLALAVACLVTYWLTTDVLAHVHSLSPSDDLLGGMWAVVATIFAYRRSYQQSVGAALSRVAATSVSFVVCLAYLLVLPFSPWGLAALVGVGTLIVTVMGRPDDTVTTAVTTTVTTTVIMVVAAISPHPAWQQPILRLADTVVGVVVGLAAAWISRAVVAGRRR